MSGAVLIQKVRNGYVMSRFTGSSQIDINEILIYRDINGGYSSEGNKLVEDMISILASPEPEPKAEPVARSEVVEVLEAAKAELEDNAS